MARFSAKCWQNCATCEFWSGPRGVNALMAAAEVEAAARGVCGANGKDSKSHATSSCIGWRKWGMLDPQDQAATPSA